MKTTPHITIKNECNDTRIDTRKKDGFGLTLTTMF